MLALFIMNFIKQLFWKKEEDYGRGEYSEGSARFDEESSEEEELVKPEKKTRGRKRGRPTTQVIIHLYAKRDHNR